MDIAINRGLIAPGDSPEFDNEVGGSETHVVVRHFEVSVEYELGSQSFLQDLESGCRHPVLEELLINLAPNLRVPVIRARQHPRFIALEHLWARQAASDGGTPWNR